MQRGSIYEHKPEGPGAFHFLYNPNSLSYTFAFNEALSDPSQTAEVRTMGPLGGTTLSMTLMINRQYEVAYGGDSQGVMNDINALKYLVGMKDDTYSYMTLKTLRFELGKNLRFYGFVNSMSAAVELFSQQMVPMAAVVQLTAFQMPVGLDPATRYNKPAGGVVEGAASAVGAAATSVTTTTTTTTSKNAWENAAANK